VKQERRKSLSTALGLLVSSATFSPSAHAAVLEIPVALDYRILEQALGEQVFSGPEQTAEVFADKIRCNTLVLSEPRVEGTDTGRIRILTTMRARTGTPMAGNCRFEKSWHALIETLHTASADPESSIVSFRVVDSNLLRPDDQGEVFPRFIRRWITDYVHPQLGAVTINLEPAVTGLQELLDHAFDGTPTALPFEQPGPLSSLKLADVRPTAESLVAVLSIDVADAPAGWAPPVAAPLAEEELAEWDVAWQTWDGFATWLIKSLAVPARPELAGALAETLLEARYELRDALAKDERDRDPVRALFLQTWERLAPLVHDLQLGLPGSQALPYATFVSAGNALQTLDQLAPHLRMRLDRHSLRSLARVLVPGVSDYELRYDTAVDPELRQLLGLEPEFEADSTPESFLPWLIRSAHATQINPELVNQLNGWVPNRLEIDSYLQSMEQLLDAIARAEHDTGKVPAQYLDLYDTLLRATAWQESCWRQYIEREGEIETIRSTAGSVGLMQINMHVWRGVYDMDAVFNNIGYNARAGNEILVHYLVDYALRKKEQEATDQPDGLARATYAMYNGGPRHLSRYRNPNTPVSLKKIDNAFWQKYRAIQSEGPMAVKRCLAG
jgi:hypothetical protein